MAVPPPGLKPQGGLPGRGPCGRGTVRPWAAYSASRAAPRRCASVTVYLDRRAARASAWRWASVRPAALRSVWRTGLVLRGATAAARPTEAALWPPALDGGSGALPPKPAASCLTVCWLCWFLVGSRVGASSGGRMPPRGCWSCGSSGASSRSPPVRVGCTGGSDGESGDGVGETITAPLGRVGLGSSLVLPKRGGSAAVGGGGQAELVELWDRWRELRRLASRLRATCPPMWRCRGDAALWFALSESALLGERTGETRGAGLVERWAGAGLAERGAGLAERRWPGAGLAVRGAGLAERWPVVPVGWACGCAPLLSASGGGLLWRALASLYRGEACEGALVAISLSGVSCGRVSCTVAAVSWAVRSAAAAACGGVRARGRH